MKLKEAQITEYKSILDSGAFPVGDVTCLVGKNEAGKTALLEALYRLRPIVEHEGSFDVTDDYPRADVEEYRYQVESGKRTTAIVTRATFALGAPELERINQDFGPDALRSNDLTLTKGYDNALRFTLQSNNDACLKALISNAQLPPDLATSLGAQTTVDALLATLGDSEATEEVQRLRATLTAIKKRDVNGYLYDTYLQSRVPHFLYFDEYYQMTGHENLEELIKRRNNNTLSPSDHPLLGLIALARLKLNDLLSPDRTQELKNSLEGAGNYLTKQILKYWSQNKHLQMKFDVRPARPHDPAGMQTGTNIWGEVYDQVHFATTGLGTRSRGFVWFFSFLAWYSGLRDKNIILLLDEPGLSLHAKAQADLLHYFEAGRESQHQLIYTTHSPFMVDSMHFDRVRIVQDRSIDAEGELPRDQAGTKILRDVLEASADSLFPLQGALGYEIHQTLFVGPNSLIVEGVSDLLYLQAISGVLSTQGRTQLSPAWTITPVGGSDKVPTFVSLIGSQKALKLATLIDFQKKDQQAIENLFKRKLLAKNHVLTFVDFTGTSEADIEDMFEPEFYLRLVNEEYKKDLQRPVSIGDLGHHPRITVRLEEYFTANPMTNGVLFSHYRPARRFAENASALTAALSAATLDRFENAFRALNALLPS